MPRWLLAVLSVAALVILAPFSPWIVLGIWLGLYAERVYVPMRRVLGGHRGVAATVTVLLLVIFMLPIATMLGSLVIDAGAMTLDTRQVPLRRPSAVAVHDHRDMAGKAIEVDLTDECLFRRSGGQG